MSESFRHRFKLLETLSQGRHGKVVLAKDNKRGQRVALKLLTTATIETDSGLLKLAHPNLVRTLEVGRDWVCMELLEGVTLQQKMSSSPPGLVECLNIGAAVANGLAYLHGENHLHLDLKPSNIFLCHDQAVKLLDIGSSGDQLEAHCTPLYAAPEVLGFRHGEVDGRADLFSLGVVLCHLLSNRVDIEKLREDTLLQSTGIVPLQEINPAVPDIVARLVGKLVASEPEKRYQTAEGLFHDLKETVKVLNRDADEVDFPLASRDFAPLDRLTLPFVGREEELAKLLELTLAGKNKPVLIRGAAGVGKTTLLNELKARLARTDNILVVGHCREGQCKTPFGPFKEIVRKLLLPNDDRMPLKRATLRAMKLLGDDLKYLVPIFPLVESEFPEQKFATPADRLVPASQIESIFVNLLQLLEQEYSGLVLGLENIHRADQATWTILERVGEERRLPTIIATSRPEERLASRLEQHFPFVVELGNLGKAQLTTILASLSKTPHTQQAIDKLWARSQGHPLKVKELLRKWTDELTEQDVEVAQNTDIESIICERLASLSSKTQKILGTCSVLGRQFSQDSLARLSGATDAELSQSLREI